MTPFPHSVAHTDSLEEAERLMSEHGIGHLPVTNGRDVVALLSSRDVLVARSIAPEAALAVEDVANTPPYIVDLHTPLSSVARMMAELHIGSAVVTREGRLAGILTTVDVCRALAELLDDSDDTPDEAA